MSGAWVDWGPPLLFAFAFLAILAAGTAWALARHVRTVLYFRRRARESRETSPPDQARK